MLFEEFKTSVFDKARAAGIEEYEIYYNAGESFSVRVFDQKIDNFDFSQAEGLSFRGLYNGKMGYAFTEVMDEAAAEMLVSSVIYNASIIEDDDVQEIFAGSPAYENAESYAEALQSVTAGQKIELAMEMERRAKAQSPFVKMAQYCMVDQSSEIIRIVNSKGLDLSARSNLICPMLVPVVEKDGRMYNDSEYRLTQDFASLNAEDIAQKAVGKAMACIGAEPVPSSRYSIVFRQDAFASLLATFASVFSAEMAQKGLSLLAGKEGEIIASDIVDLIDDPFLPESYNIRTFDAEGVATKYKKLITAGRLDTLMHNLKTAKKAGVESTGNASRAGYAGSVRVAPTNLYIAPGNDGADALMATREGGLYITELSGLHSGANAMSGDFSLLAKGFVIEGGKPGRPVDGITVAGNFFELMKQIDGIGNDLKMDMPGSGGCYGSPTVCVSALQVAGK